MALFELPSLMVCLGEILVKTHRRDYTEETMRNSSAFHCELFNQISPFNKDRIKDKSVLPTLFSLCGVCIILAIIVCALVYISGLYCQCM